MNRLTKAVAVPLFAMTLCAIPVLGQDHHDDARAQDQQHGDQDHRDNHKYVRHDDWRKGQHMRQEDWNRGDRVDDWHSHHLRRPPRGDEWREVDGNFVLASPDGVIIQIVPERR